MVHGLTSANVFLTQILQAYSQAVEALTTRLAGLPPYLVGIDGRDGSGKTTLGRYLAWTFNISLIETDLFLVGGQDELKYYDDQIQRIIRVRLAKSRPVIVEGVALLRLLNRLCVKPDFLVYVRHPEQSSGRILESILDGYETEYSPETKYDLY
jgi:hypothetical protein